MKSQILRNFKIPEHMLENYVGVDFTLGWCKKIFAISKSQNKLLFRSFSVCARITKGDDTLWKQIIFFCTALLHIYRISRTCFRFVIAIHSEKDMTSYFNCNS